MIILSLIGDFLRGLSSVDKGMSIRHRCDKYRLLYKLRKDIKREQKDMGIKL